MTPVQRVRRARVALAGTALFAALLWSGAAGMTVITLSTVAPAVGLPAAVAFLWPLAIAATLGTIAAMLWWTRAVWSLERVALWLEERAPELRYALVTSVDPRYADGAAMTVERHAALVEAASRANVEAIVRRSIQAAVLWAVAAVLVTATAVRLLHATNYFAGIGRRRSLDEATKPLGNRLAKLRAEIVPPVYTGLARRTVSDPTNVAGLIGTQIRFLGDGPPTGITAIVDRDTLVKDTLVARIDSNGWALPMPMPTVSGLIRFQDRTYHRSVVLEPLLDSVPRVLLRSPANDTTWRWDRPPRGELVLEAELEDDYGITNAFFEILISTGGEENFETKDKSTPRISFGGKTQGTLRTTLSYAALGVAPGTVFHIRAIAYDNNAVADSAGKGMSETRTLRVATKEESDTSSVRAADPLPIDSLWIGQRVLNARTDTLIRFRQPKIAHQAYVDTSITYADYQKDIRQRVEEVVLMLEDDGVGGRMETEASRLLRAASEQMWQARQYLAIGMPDSAYVLAKSSMKEALRLLEEARKARKYYIRGVLQARPVNLAEVRLKGTDDGSAGDRTGRGIPQDLRRALRSRLAALAPLAVASPQGVVDSLMLIRAAALRGAPAVATALQTAIDAARQGKSPILALARARRLLDPLPRITAGPAEWSGGVLP